MRLSLLVMRLLLLGTTALSLLLYTLFFLWVYRDLQYVLVRDVELQTLRIQSILEAKLDRAEQSVVDITALFSTSDSVSENMFANFVQESSLFERSDHFRAVAIMPMLSEDDLAPVNAALQARESDRTALGYKEIVLEPAEGRTIYALVIYAESPQGRGGIVGYDLATSPVRLKTAEAARDGDRVLVTPPLTLSQDDPTAYLSLLLIGAVDSADLGLCTHQPEEADKPLLVALSYTPGAEIQATLEGMGKRLAELNVVDVTDAEPAVIYTDNPETLSRVPLLTSSISFAGRTWSLNYYPLEKVDGGVQPYWLIGIYAFGVVLLLGLAIAVFVLIKNADSLAVNVQMRTRDLDNANADLRKLADEARAANRAKTDFLANMSHELRTPLNAIIGYSEVMTSQLFGKIGNPKYQEYANDILSSGKILDRLLSDILDVTRIESRSLDLAEEEFDVGRELETCVKLVSNMAGGKGITIQTTIPSPDLRLFADAQRFRQIVLNLLSNAVKFSPDNNEVKLFAVVQPDNCVMISVKDDGPGMAPEDIEKVQEPFEQGGDILTRSQDGSGLGLAICKMLIELHGGTLRLESTLGVGTTVFVRFPASRTRVNL